MDASDEPEDDGANVDLDSHRKGFLQTLLFSSLRSLRGRQNFHSAGTRVTFSLTPLSDCLSPYGWLG
jgi:hypothetical protein